MIYPHIEYEKKISKEDAEYLEDEDMEDEDEE